MLNISAENQIPSDWKCQTLGDICVNSQYGINSASGKGKFYPMLRMNNLQNGKIDTRDLTYIELSASEFEKYSLKVDDLLINRTNSYELVGKTALFNLKEEYVFASYLVRFQLDRSVVDPRYVSYWLNSYKGKQNLQMLATKGVSQANINPTVLRNQFILPLPPLQEQHRIADILNIWDETIELTEQLITAKQKLRQALMQRLLTGKVRFPEFNAEWADFQLGSLANLTAGGTPSTTVQAYWGGNIRWMNSGEVNSRYIYEVEGRITQLGLDNSSAKLIPPNSVMIALAGQGKTRGMVAVNKVETTTNQSIAAIMPDPSKLDYMYLFFNLDNRYDEMRLLSGGNGGRGGLNLTILKNVPIRLPTIQEQQKIAEILSACDIELDLLQQKLTALRQQKKGLMQQLLTGKIRVKI